MVCKTQTRKHLGVAIYINPCANVGKTRSRTQIHMVLVGQPKHDTILDGKGDIYVMGYRKYKVSLKKLSSKWAPH